jgi:parvulin-like peptidyl-prolyl isomerase
MRLAPAAVDNDVAFSAAHMSSAPAALEVRLILPKTLAALLALAPALASAADPAAPETYLYLSQEDGTQVKAPLFARSTAQLAVAKVGDEVITVQELSSALAVLHQGAATAADARAGKKEFAGVLDRMIEVRLLLQEAEAMGIAELPEFQQAMKDFGEETKRVLLQRHVLKGARADPKEVDRLYREAAREWKLRSVLFAKESDAKTLQPALAEAKSFDVAARQLVAAKKAKGGAEAAFFPRDQMLPEVLEAVRKLTPGQVSAPIRVSEGFAIVRLEAIRHRDDPKARAAAEEKALGIATKRALEGYYQGLLKSYVRRDKALLKELDLEAPKPGFAALEKDGRVLARVEGGKPVTVADLATELTVEFYHGIENAIREKKVNRVKERTLDALLSKQVVALEASRLGIPSSFEYRAAMEEFRRSVLFNELIAKAVLPDVQIEDEAVEKAYQQRKAEFMYPGFYKLESIGFVKLADAEVALKKLQSGTELRWLLSNADGQVKDAEADVQLTGGTVAATTLPKGLRALLDGAKKGDWRLYASERKHTYVIHVLEITAPQPKPLDAVRDDLRQRLTNERVQASVKEWAAKIRQARPVKIYLTKIDS